MRIPYKTLPATRSSLDPHCSQRRSVDEWGSDTFPDADTDADDDIDLYDARYGNASSVFQRDFGSAYQPTITSRDLEELLEELESRGLGELEKRQLQAIFGIMIRIGLWGSRVAENLSARASSFVANASKDMFAIMQKNR
jgi:hypothetical protein